MPVTHRTPSTLCVTFIARKWSHLHRKRSHCPGHITVSVSWDMSLGNVAPGREAALLPGGSMEMGAAWWGCAVHLDRGRRRPLHFRTTYMESMQPLNILAWTIRGKRQWNCVCRGKAWLSGSNSGQDKVVFTSFTCSNLSKGLHQVTAHSGAAIGWTMDRVSIREDGRENSARQKFYKKNSVEMGIAWHQSYFGSGLFTTASRKNIRYNSQWFAVKSEYVGYEF